MKKLALAAALVAAFAAPAFADEHGDAAAGEKVFNVCKACHLIGDASGKKIGPSLNGLFGRTAGTLEGFEYSDAMKAKGAEGVVWTPEVLAEYIVKPKDYVPGTKMAYAGLKDEKKIADLVAFLLTHSPDYAPTESESK